MVRILAQLDERDMSPKRVKKVRLGIYRRQIRLRDHDILATSSYWKAPPRNVETLWPLEKPLSNDPRPVSSDLRK